MLPRGSSYHSQCQHFFWSLFLFFVQEQHKDASFHERLILLERQFQGATVMLYKNGVLAKVTGSCVIDIIVIPSVSLEEIFVQNTNCIA